MKRAVEKIPWFLTSLGVALLAIAVLLAPVGQSQALAVIYHVGCEGDYCCNGQGGSGNCCGMNPDVGCYAGPLSCVSANESKFHCMSCVCQAVTVQGKLVCGCR